MANEFGKGIPLSTSFDLGSTLPLDSRSIVECLDDLRDLKKNNLVCDGLTVFVRNGELDNEDSPTGVLYQYTGSYTNYYDEENPVIEEWTEIGSYPKVKSLVNITATEIRAEVDDKEAALYSKIQLTADAIRAEVAEKEKNLYSKITQTSNEIRTEVANKEKELYSKITETATQIRSEVTDVNNQLSSTITQTAASIRSEVVDAKNQLSSTIEQTATSIRSEVTDVKNKLTSHIIQTSAKQYRTIFLILSNLFAPTE